MELNEKKFALAAAKTMGIWYILCATLVAVAPALAMKLFGWMVHLVNLDSAVSAGVTLGGFIVGFLEVVVLAYATAWLFVTIYNRLLKQG